MSDIASLIYALAALLGTAGAAYLGWPATEPFNARKFFESLLRASPAAVLATLLLPAADLSWNTAIYICFSAIAGPGLDVLLKRGQENLPKKAPLAPS